MKSLNHRRAARSGQPLPETRWGDMPWPAPLPVLAVLGAAVSGWAVLILTAYRVIAPF